MNPGPQVTVPPDGVSRRQLLRWGGGLAAGALGLPMLSACTGSGEAPDQGADPGDSADGPVTLAWWDHFRPLTSLFEDDLFASYSKAHSNVTIERRQMDGGELGQALQLARRSKQLPDVHSTAGLETAAAVLVESGWFQPIDDAIEIDKTPVKDYIFDGIHRFDGKVYTLPLFSSQFHQMSTWTNTELLKKADVDPTDGPRTWDDYRAAVKKIDKGTPDDVHGIFWPMKEPEYLTEKINTLAQVAGAPGMIDWHTGEYVMATDPFFEAMEFMLALQKDGVMHPASASMGQRDARARWAAGEAALYAWGPWIIGGLMVEEADAVERGMSVWQVPAPGASPAPIYSGPSGGSFWVSDQSKNPRVAADLLGQMVTEDFFRQLAARMDQPPILEEVVADADVHDAYRKNIEYFASDMRLSPVPEVRNPGVVDVIVEMRDIHPNPGEIVQAVLTGSTRDYRKAFKEYADKMTKERDRAIKVATTKGTEVSRADWVFDNWQPDQDFTQDQYK